MRRLIPLLLTLAFVLPGCSKRDGATYTGIEAGYIQAGVFTSDNGTAMNIVGNEGKFDITSGRRVLVQYETRPTSGSGRIDIDLLTLWETLILLPGPAGTLPDSPEGSPMQVSDAWFGGQYLNVLATFEGKDPSLHGFGARFTADENGIVLRLSHDASQETDPAGQLLGIFLTIPVNEPIRVYEQAVQSQGKKTPYPVSVLLQWTARTMEGDPLTLYEQKGSYTPPSTN